MATSWSNKCGLKQQGIVRYHLKETGDAVFQLRVPFTNMVSSPDRPVPPPHVGSTWEQWLGAEWRRGVAWRGVMLNPADGAISQLISLSGDSFATAAGLAAAPFEECGIPHWLIAPRQATPRHATPRLDRVA